MSCHKVCISQVECLLSLKQRFFKRLQYARILVLNITKLIQNAHAHTQTHAHTLPSSLVTAWLTELTVYEQNTVSSSYSAHICCEYGFNRWPGLTFCIGQSVKFERPLDAGRSGI